VGRRWRRGEHMHALGLFGFERLKRALPGRRSEHMHALGPFGFERPAQRSSPSAGASAQSDAIRRNQTQSDARHDAHLPAREHPRERHRPEPLH
jgi:hypothetical protein